MRIIMLRFHSLVLIVALLPTSELFADDAPAPANRAAVPGTLRLHLRERKETAPKSGVFNAGERIADWKVAETAVIICDMWEDHPCKMAAHRVDVMAPEMNRIVAAARSLGVQIIHAPSEGMQYYDTAPQRLRLKSAPKATPPFAIERWCFLDPAREADYPIPYTKTRDDCDDPELSPDTNTSRRQHPAIKIVGYDGCDGRVLPCIRIEI